MSLQLSKNNATLVGDEINKYTKLYETLCKKWYYENNINEDNLPIVMFMKLTWNFQKKRYDTNVNRLLQRYTKFKYKKDRVKENLYNIKLEGIKGKMDMKFSEDLFSIQKWLDYGNLKTHGSVIVLYNIGGCQYSIGSSGYFYIEFQKE